MRPSRWSLACALGLAACATQPYRPPAVALPAAYRNAALQSPAAAAPVTAGWWRAFGDPVLDRVVDGALAGSLSVEAAAARLQQAAADVRAARAERLPLVTGGASVTRQTATLEDPIGRFAANFPGYRRTSELYGLNVAASWEIDLFGRLAAGARAARADADSAAADLAGARLTVAAEVAGAYLDARELEARLAIARARVGTLGELDRLVRLRFAKGVAARLEVDQVDADLASARAAEPALTAARELALTRIDVLSGRVPGTAAALLGAGLLPLAPAVTADAPAALLLARPDLVAAERAVAAADARVAQALADRLPRLSLSALVGLLSGGVGALFTGDATQSSVGASLAGPLLDFGRGAANVARARGRTREVVASYRLAVLRAIGEVEDGLSSLARRKDQAAGLGIAAAALARARDTSRRAYTGGVISLLDALDTERRLQAAQDSAATARADAARAAVAAYRALGGGFAL